MCSQILHCVLESHIQIHPVRATQLEDVCYEHGFVEQLNLAAREAQFIWHSELCERANSRIL